MTNYEKIKAMSVEEMAKHCAKIATCSKCPACGECRYWGPKACADQWIRILLQEAEE